MSVSRIPAAVVSLLFGAAAPACAVQGFYEPVAGVSECSRLRSASTRDVHAVIKAADIKRTAKFRVPLVHAKEQSVRDSLMQDPE